MIRFYISKFLLNTKKLQEGVKNALSNGNKEKTAKGFCGRAI